ncbi:ABC transporter substrate-binding protein [Parablautia intestinalis]|uniref:ABC transporter substrate-binding protein n=1 Tax=Parablautia intestinalis TaxID=2320100 RepID=A0A3A9AQF2_9FIRM|nr:amino acid ABC transporter substrate-binding protein [Parablautia intestinalis]RKI93274.1 ABC transporter substrate-binding protein [Parablautia intestinalis]
MKKNLIVLLMAAMTAGLFSGCGSKADEPKKTAAVETGESAGSESTENENPGKESADDENAGGEAEESGDAADERTTFTVGFDAEFPPYGYMDENGEYTGFDLELAQEVCARRGWELVKQPIDWDSKDMELSSGSIDCIWNGFTMNGREDAYTWSVPYVDNSQVFVVKSDAGIVSFDDFAGKIVGVQRDSSALAALEGDAADLAGTFSELRQYADYNTGFMDLEAGAIDGLAVDIGVADYQIESRGDGYVILEERLATEQYGIGFLLGNDELKQQVESTLLEMEEDGKFMEIASKYGLEDSVCLGK